MLPVISVENLSKKYIISHLKPERYTTLRDVLSNGVQHFSARLRHPFAAPENISTHEEFWALKDVSFDIQQGDRVGIIGCNGAGKSTLLKILSRITEPTAGRVKISGRVASLLEVGTGFHPELTGRENIFLNGAILGMSKVEIKKKFDEIVAFAEVERFLDTPVKHYSSGMYVRLAFAVAAHLEPEILIVDEVLAVGDAQFQKKCLGKMEDVSKEGRTVLFVSHNMGAVRTFCERAALLHDGHLLTLGDVNGVISEYARNFQPSPNPVIELNVQPRVNADAYPKRLRLYGRDRVPTAQFRIGEPWTVELEFQANRPLRSVIAAIGVTTLDGVPVVTYWSAPQDLEAGAYRVDFEVNETFRSRDFSIGVGLSSIGCSLYYQENCATAAVLEISEGKQPFRATGSSLLAGNQDARIERIS